MDRRRFLATALPLAALASSGCIGSFALTKKVYNWNRNMGSPIVSEIIFLVLVFVLPVYSITLFIDGVLLNTIEFLTGGNPVAEGPAEGAEHISELGEGGRLRLRRRRGQLELQITQPDGTRLARRFEKHEDGLRVWDEDDLLIADARFDADGGIEVFDGVGRSVAWYDPEQVNAAAQSFEEGGAEGLLETARELQA